MASRTFLSRSKLPVKLFAGNNVFARSYAITSSTPYPPRTALAKPYQKPTTRPLKASTYATSTDKTAELEAFAEINGSADIPAESVPSSRVLQASVGRESAVTEDVSKPLPTTFESVTDSNGFTDWSRSYQGLGAQPFPKESIDVLMAPIDPLDIEVKPEGLIYLPEIKYRRVLNKAFGPGGWGLAPRSETNVGPKIVSREYALICLGRLVAVARGEQEYFDPSGIATAVEASKSNALMRCCKDLGVASELWDPRFIREFKAKHCVEVFAEHATTKKKKKLWRRKDTAKFDYPWKE
ncbi:mitochondrial genome maintenance MGM101-domain-containing protein [Cytidiella melzeri]|nr:mitochondrial genome maintenance MGM101-domain-containing protein [Cytidiella melzeri]